MRFRAWTTLPALLLAALVAFAAAGCGRKAKPDPRTASRAPVAAPYDIAPSR